MGIKRRIKKGLSLILALSMLVPSLALIPSINSMAALTELINENSRFPNNGHTNSAVYTWKQTRTFGDNTSVDEPSWSFDIKGRGADGSDVYSDDTHGTQTMTTFDDGGYVTYIVSGNAVNHGNGSTFRWDVPENAGVQVINDVSIALDGLELKQVVSPAPDGMHVLVDFYIHNAAWANRNNIRLGLGAAIRMGSDFRAPAYKNDRGISVVNRETNATFELVTDAPALGVTPVDTRWLGVSNFFEMNMFTESAASEMIPDPNGGSGISTGIAISWNIGSMQPHETVHRRVAFLVRDTTYYVDPVNGVDDSTTNNGTFSKPFKTIGYAMNRIGQRKGYINLMENYTLTQAESDIINEILGMGGGYRDITISSTDYDREGNPIDANVSRKILTRGGDNTEELFRLVNPNSRLSFYNIILDGDNIEASGSMVSASAGSISLMQGTEIRNAKVNTDVGSAINATGNSNLSINSSIISGNTTHTRGAVHFANNGKFSIGGRVNILNNFDISGQPSNVYLGEAVLGNPPDDPTQGITIEGALEGGSNIGITTSRNVGMNPLQVIFPSDNVPEISIYRSMFSADLANVGVDVVTVGNTGIALQREPVNVRIRTVGVVPVVTDVVIPKNAGDTESIIVTVHQNYVLKDVYVDPSNAEIRYFEGSEQVSEPTSEVEYGNVTKLELVVPDESTTVTLEYKPVTGGYEFRRYPFGTGGADSAEAVIRLMGNAGTPISGMVPIISRVGYRFDGWVDEDGNSISSNISTYPEGTLVYYPQWDALEGATFTFNTQHSNMDGSLNFGESSGENRAEMPIYGSALNVRGYVLNDYIITPTHNDISESTGSVDPDSHDFVGTQPNETLTLLYRYRPDVTQTQDLTIRYVNSLGDDLRPQVTRSLVAEQAILENKLVIAGYRYSSAVLDGGDVGSGLTSVDINDLNVESGLFNSRMPNQDVTLTYIYDIDIDANLFITQYMFEGSPLLEDKVEYEPPATAVTTSFVNIYGYKWSSQHDDPTNTGTFTDHNYSAIMPSDSSLVVTYEYEKEPSQWGTITYKAGSNGTLSNDDTDSSVVQVVVGKTYETEIIINNGTPEGANGGYTWAELKGRHLVPEAVATNHYAFDGWFFDTNNNGIKDTGEEYVTEDTNFNANMTVTASFVQDSSMWATIHFESTGNGTISKTTYETTNDKTWGDLKGEGELPELEAGPFYLADPKGWRNKLNGQVVNDNIRVEDGAIYVINFIRDPNIFGLELQTPPAIGNIDLNGSGKITVYETMANYKYVITDVAGNVVDAKSGNAANRLTFQNLNAGTRYKVYEVLGTASVGDLEHIGLLPGTSISTPKEVLIPVLDNNYVVTYDENNEGRTKIVINPADSKMDYAILDKDGNVVLTPETRENGWQTPNGNASAVVKFSDLEYNKEYIIVTILRNEANGTQPSQKQADGSRVVTEPRGDGYIPKYIVETINGTVTEVLNADGVPVTEGNEGNRHSNIMAGDKVSISAPSSLSGEAFLGWEILIGNVQGINLSQENNITFTMPKTNVVFHAKYARNSTGNANVIDEVRGGNRTELALYPNEIPNLEQDLTQQLDRDLMNTGVDVTYRVVFNKNSVSVAERIALKGESSHQQAYEAAWGLDVNIERYVGGRKVSIPNATSSDATFTVITQLDINDVDMLDYKLFEVDAFGNPMSEITLSADPDETGGLFRFTASAGSRYVLTYSKAYRITVIDPVGLYRNNEFFTASEPQFYRFKVRRSGNIKDGNYNEHRDWILAHTPTPLPEDVKIIDSDGVEYTFVDWSLSDYPDDLRTFALNTVIEKITIIYAYYTNNRKELLDKVESVDNLLNSMHEQVSDHILFEDERNYAIAVVEEAMGNIVAGMTIKDMDRVIKKMMCKLNNPAIYADEFDSSVNGDKSILQRIEERRVVYNDQHKAGNISSSGGSGAGGGSGNGSAARPFVPASSNSYSIGVHGNWELEEGSSNRWSFRLNGGIKLAKIWAWLEHTSADVSRIGWYHFNSMGIMSSGWFQDEAGDWYYSNEDNAEWFGEMFTGWKLNSSDNNWYHLDESTGKMAKGWKLVGGQWYYFTDVENIGRPVGSMYAGEITPDGYKVDASGAYVE
jgi:FOG: Glucan-binding domain (YG repeat)